MKIKLIAIFLLVMGIVTFSTPRALAYVDSLGRVWPGKKPSAKRKVVKKVVHSKVHHKVAVKKNTK